MKFNSWSLIYALGITKLLVHFLTNTNYGLHRDEFLYFDQGKHLAWGFYEVPPFTPFIGALADLLGGSVFAIRFFPALAGSIIIILSCKLIKDLGGGTSAILLTGSALLLSPALLGTNTLFQPVSFNQLFWFLLAYSIVEIIRNPTKRKYVFIGVIVGLGILTKYSIAFYVLALLIGVLATKQRVLVNKKAMITTIVLSLLISLPNILWQFNNGFPLIQHMGELSTTQLVHVRFWDFLGSQLFVHKGFSIFWLLGLVGLFKLKDFSPFKSVGLAFLITIILIGILQGKSYYTLGAFLILFPFGGLALSHYLTSSKVKVAVVACAFVLTAPFYPFSFPLLKVDGLKNYARYLSENVGIRDMLRWEDGRYYELPQDIADMYGWEELAQKVANIYHSLPDDRRARCMIYGGSYGHAGSLNFFRHKYDLPETYSLNGSYASWAEKDIDFDNQIMVDDRRQESSEWFDQMNLVDSITNPYAREKGYIYYRANPKIDVVTAWRNNVLESRNR